MVDRPNLLVKTFKQANPNLTHEKAQKRVKEYYDMIKNKLDVEKLVKIGKNWLETHVYISTCCLQIAKCNNIECCQPVRRNMQEVLGGEFLPAPLALSGNPCLIDPCKRDKTQKISEYDQSLALQHLRPKGYEKCL